MHGTAEIEEHSLNDEFQLNTWISLITVRISNNICGITYQAFYYV